MAAEVATGSAFRRRLDTRNRPVPRSLAMPSESHELTPFRLSSHAKDRWGESKAVGDLETAYRRAMHVGSDDSGTNHCIDPESRMHFVVQYCARQLVWIVVTVYPHTSKKDGRPFGPCQRHKHSRRAWNRRFRKDDRRR